MTSGDTLLQEQIAYYRARASEYDEWFLRQGRYDHGPTETRKWFAEVEQMERALAAFAPTGDVLELACGTGLWTQQLANYATRITAVDSSPEVLAISRRRLAERGASIEYLEANLFSWQPTKRYDVVFFSFWLSHVPPERFTAFWDLVRQALAPGGRVFFIDSLYSETSTARDHQLEGKAATSVMRRLNDGQEFRIVKVFYRPEKLAAQLETLGWQADVQATFTFFLYGAGMLENSQRAASPF
jgi:demethylmenaquinone methyltransferase/2-methoxy-6-polyprenyl-1,4-benzoquinol methylase